MVQGMLGQSSKKKILFLCTGNSIRSQMAEAYFRTLGNGDWEVMSAGVSPAGIHAATIVVMREDGIDLEGQWSKSIDEIPLAELSYLITLCGHARELCPVMPNRVATEHWPIDDPIAAAGATEERLTRFRATRDELKRRVKDLLERLLT